MTSTGTLEAIWVKRARQAPMDPRESVQFVTGCGIEDNANQGGHRQVTIIEKEKWDAIIAELGAALDPSIRRANLMVTGIDLAESRGRILQIGKCRLRVFGETRPCNLMAEAYPGLEKAMDPDWRGGIFAEVLDDGEVSVGDRVEWLPEEE